MRVQWPLFCTALSYFSRIPVSPSVCSTLPLAAAIGYFPWVGLLLASLMALVLWISTLIMPLPLAVVGSVASGIWLTGALHEDGWADSCDGLGGGFDAARRLAIMKDSRLGSYGAIGLVLMLMAKISILIEIASLDLSCAVFALLIAHPLSRLFALWLIQILPYVRQEDCTRAGAMVQHLHRGQLITALLGGLLPAVLLLPFTGILLVLGLSVVVTWMMIRLFNRLLGGYTGDCLGATQQCVELACYAGIWNIWNFI